MRTRNKKLFHSRERSTLYLFSSASALGSASGSNERRAIFIDDLRPIFSLLSI